MVLIMLAGAGHTDPLVECIRVGIVGIDHQGHASVAPAMEHTKDVSYQRSADPLASPGILDRKLPDPARFRVIVAQGCADDLFATGEKES